MLKQIDFTTNQGLKYIMLYDSDYLTEEQALIECEFVGCGGGHDYNLFPHYVIIDEEKRPILKAIGNHVRLDTAQKMIQHMESEILTVEGIDWPKFGYLKELIEEADPDTFKASIDRIAFLENQLKESDNAMEEDQTNHEKWLEEQKKLFNAAVDHECERVELLLNDLDQMIKNDKKGFYSAHGNYLGECVPVGLFTRIVDQLRAKYLPGKN